jgi:hypothetical protein
MAMTARVTLDLYRVRMPMGRLISTSRLAVSEAYSKCSAIATTARRGSIDDDSATRPSILCSNHMFPLALAGPLPLQLRPMS